MIYGLTEREFNIILEYLKNYKEVEDTVLFDSRVLNTYKKPSDVDSALKGKLVTPFIAARLKSSIEDETAIPYFFDFVSYPQLKHKDFVRHSDEYGILIYRKQ